MSFYCITRHMATANVIENHVELIGQDISFSLHCCIPSQDYWKPIHRENSVLKIWERFRVDVNYVSLTYISLIPLLCLFSWYIYLHCFSKLLHSFRNHQRFCLMTLHTEESFLNIFKENQIWIVWKHYFDCIFVEICMVPNLSDKCNYNKCNQLINVITI